MRIIIRTLLICSLLVGSPTQAAEWKIDPTISLEAGYNDNLNLDIDNEVSTAEATFSPSAVFSVATPTSGANGIVRFDFRRFEEDSDLDDDNSRFEIRSFHNMEKSRVGLDLGFTKDTTLDSQLEATGLAFARVDRERANISPNWAYNFNERTRVSANYSYTDVEYKDAGGTGFVNYTLSSAQASVSRVLNDRSTGSITLSRTKSDNDNDVESTNTNLQGGTSYRFNETLSASLFVGARYTEVDFSQTSLIPIFLGPIPIGFIQQTEDVSNSDWGSTFSANITKTFLRGETSLSASRNVSNDINGRPIEVTRLGLNNIYRFTSILSASLNLDFYNSEVDSDVGSSLNRNYYQVSPKFTWDFKNFWSLSGSYRYRKQTYDDTSSDATQNAAYLTLTYLWPRIAVSR